MESLLNRQMYSIIFTTMKYIIFYILLSIFFLTFIFNTIILITHHLFKENLSSLPLFILFFFFVFSFNFSLHFYTHTPFLFCLKYNLFYELYIIVNLRLITFLQSCQPIIYPIIIRLNNILI